MASRIWRRAAVAGLAMAALVTAGLPGELSGPNAAAANDPIAPGAVRGQVSGPIAARRIAPPPALRGRDATLIFHDEFSGSHLDDQAWLTCYPHGMCFNSGSEEQQGYVPDHVVVGAGSASFVATAEPTTVRDRAGQHIVQPYRSGMIASTFSFTYGYAEVRARVPFDAGLWPAIWMLPTDSPGRPRST
ncbi:MAG: family 16 glycosylhydrolase [Ilumatobacteraceae bacterium]